jgi:hypothetical protein
VDRAQGRYSSLILTVTHSHSHPQSPPSRPSPPPSPLCACPQYSAARLTRAYNPLTLVSLALVLVCAYVVADNVLFRLAGLTVRACRGVGGLVMGFVVVLPCARRASVPPGPLPPTHHYVVTSLPQPLASQGMAWVALGLNGLIFPLCLGYMLWAYVQTVRTLKGPRPATRLV